VAVVSKSWIARALIQKACSDNRSVLLHRCPGNPTRLRWAEVTTASIGCSGALARVELIFDDRILSPPTAVQCRDPMETLEDRHGLGSIIVTSQLPIERWEIIGDPNIGRHPRRLAHNEPRLILKGESLRKTAAKHQKLDAEPAE